MSRGNGEFQVLVKSLRLMLWLVCSVVTVVPEALSAEAPPNIVVILADDHTYRDFGFMGNVAVQTPHLDRLASESALFPNGYVPMSVCRPSLATVLTGLYPHQHGIYFNHPPPGLAEMRKLSAEEYHQARRVTDPLIRQRATLPRILTEQGYVSLQTGKHWEGHFTDAGFTHGMTTGRPTPADRYGTRLQNGEPVAHGNGDAGLAIGRDTMQPIATFLDEQVRGKPFLIWYAPFLPHVPFDAGPEFQEPYRKQGLPAQLRAYYAEITRFDHTVGQLREMLAQRSLTHNTLIVFASDNGYRPEESENKSSSPRADARSKWSAHEDGIRTPLLFNWPGKIAPARYEGLVQTVDLLPTIAAAAGCEQALPKNLPGQNLLPVCLGEAELPQRPAFGAIYPNDATELNAPENHVLARWMRLQKFKLIVPEGDNPDIPLQLYDLQRDPAEYQNLADDPAYRVALSRLMLPLNAWWQP
ncbi:MAG: sulfatase-like hydrolase/transferase [Planctomycetaceae bacterium]|nr:sulfatase-like hydrolase/transferase [Planctomycetaceae bacterium]